MSAQFDEKTGRPSPRGGRQIGVAMADTVNEQINRIRCHGGNLKLWAALRRWIKADDFKRYRRCQNFLPGSVLDLDNDLAKPAFRELHPAEAGGHHSGFGFSNIDVSKFDPLLIWDKNAVLANIEIETGHTVKIANLTQCSFAAMAFSERSVSEWHSLFHHLSEGASLTSPERRRLLNQIPLFAFWDWFREIHAPFQPNSLLQPYPDGGHTF